MPTYQAVKGTEIYTRNFTDLAAAEAYFKPLLPDCVVSLAPVQEVKSDAEKLADRQQFGKELVNQYLLENDAIAKSWGRPFTVAEAAQQAQKLQLVMALLPNGSLKQVVDILTGTTADSILTQDRINSYITALNNFIAGQ